MELGKQLHSTCIQRPPETPESSREKQNISKVLFSSSFVFSANFKVYLKQLFPSRGIFSENCTVQLLLVECTHFLESTSGCKMTYRHFKKLVSRDFLLQVFSWIIFPPSPWKTHTGICHRCQQHRWSTFSCEYLRESSKKFETDLTRCPGAWGKLIHEKIWSWKSRGTVL